MTNLLTFAMFEAVRTPFIYELRYVPKEGAPRVKHSRYEFGFGFAGYELPDDVYPETDQALELAVRWYKKHPPADLDFWSDPELFK